jgi:diaminohydroxyphosphoribosylaminopyrimidine deaminase/5-amino-6-(5-phosphoribosylamino)uracil reductase
LEQLTAVDLAQATLYVNLEPCCFSGKTPPCTDLIIEKGVKRVVFGMIDPNPKVCCRGAEALRKAGVEVKGGVLEKQCREINRSYIKYITTGIPEVIIKAAASLDGRIATSSGDARWISSKESRIYAHKLRAENDAVLVGVGTVIADNPVLNVRHIKGRNPLRVVLDSELQTPLNANVTLEQDKLPTIFFTSEKAQEDKIAQFRDLGCKVEPVSLDYQKRLSLPDVLKHLGECGVSSLLVEGGTSIFTSFLKQELVDRIIIAIAPKIIGGDGLPLINSLAITKMGKALTWKYHIIRKSGDDILLDILVKEY